MKRRTLLLASAAWATLAAARARAQKEPRRIGWLFHSAPTAVWARVQFEAVSAKLAELGYVVGRDIVFEQYWTDNKDDALPLLARALVVRKPALIFATASPVAAALQKETRSVPILMVNIGEPVEQGFVASLARPGGNITGTTFRYELMHKLVELIHETLPEVRRIALLEDVRFSVSKRVTMRMNEAATALGYKLNVVHLKGTEGLERAYAELARDKTEALILPPQYVGLARTMVDLAMKARIATFGNYRQYAEAGALVCNYTETADGYQRVAVMADKILKGAKPADLPVEEPERMYVAVNQRSAKELGVKIPQSVLLRADVVIE